MIFAYHFAAAINSARETTLCRIITYFHDDLKTYQASEIRCNFPCDSTVLGALTKASLSIDVLNSPEPPYKGTSLNSLTEHMLKIRVPSLCALNGKSTPMCSHIESMLNYTILLFRFEGVELTTTPKGPILPLQG